MLRELCNDIELFIGRWGDLKRRVAQSDLTLIRQAIFTADRNERDTLTKKVMKRWRSMTIFNSNINGI